jgi:hypothetical protein
MSAGGNPGVWVTLTIPWLCEPPGAPLLSPPRSMSSISAKMPLAGSIRVHCHTSGIRKSILAVRLVERPAVLQQAVEQLGGAAAGRRHVDMRIGAVADHRTCVAHHLRGQVGVVVEAGDDRHPVPDQRADAAQQLAFAILVMLGDHRAMQVEIDAVERPSRREVVENAASDLLVSLALDIGGRRRRAPAQWHQVVAEPLNVLTAPAIGRLNPSTASISSGPRTKPGHASARSKSAQVARCGAKVLVSC